MHNSRTPRRSCEVQSPGGVTVTFESSSAASNVFSTVAYYCAEHNRHDQGVQQQHFGREIDALD